MDSGTVERLQAPNAEAFIERYRRERRPFVVQGAIDHWTIRQRWTWDYFASLQGQDVVAPRAGTSEQVSLPLRDYVAQLGSGTLGTAWVHDPQPALLQDADFPPYNCRPAEYRWVFLGRDSRSALHYHPGYDSILAQVSGKKRFTLFSPDQTRYLAPFPFYHYGFNGSRYGVDVPPSDHPLYSQAKPITVDLDAGEMMYVPTHWWHWVESIGDSFSIVMFWRSDVYNLQNYRRDLLYLPRVGPLWWAKYAFSKTQELVTRKHALPTDSDILR